MRIIETGIFSEISIPARLARLLIYGPPCMAALLRYYPWCGSGPRLPSDRQPTGVARSPVGSLSGTDNQYGSVRPTRSAIVVGARSRQR